MKWRSVINNELPEEGEYVLWNDTSRNDKFKYFVARVRSEPEGIFLAGAYIDIYEKFRDDILWCYIQGGKES